MLTLKEINDVSFRKSSFSGYKPEDVDDFIDAVTETVKELTKENRASSARVDELSAKNIELVAKLKVLADKIETYREDEEGIKSAILSAQKLGSSSLKDAKMRADKIIVEANKKSEDMLLEAKKKTSDLISSYDLRIKEKENEFNEIKSRVTAFKSSLFEMYRSHLNEIENIPDFTQELEEKKYVLKSVVPTTTPEPKIEEEPQVEVVPEEVQAPAPVTMEIATEEKETKVGMEDTIVIPDIEEIEEEVHSSYDDDYQDYVIDDSEDDKSVSKENFDTIDFNAYSNIPEALKKEKENLFDTLEFGEGINVKNRK